MTFSPWILYWNSNLRNLLVSFSSGLTISRKFDWYGSPFSGSAFNCLICKMTENSSSKPLIQLSLNRLHRHKAFFILFIGLTMSIFFKNTQKPRIMKIKLVQFCFCLSACFRRSREPRIPGKCPGFVGDWFTFLRKNGEMEVESIFSRGKCRKFVAKRYTFPHQAEPSRITR